MIKNKSSKFKSTLIGKFMIVNLIILCKVSFISWPLDTLEKKLKFKSQEIFNLIMILMFSIVTKV